MKKEALDILNESDSSSDDDKKKSSSSSKSSSKKSSEKSQGSQRSIEAPEEEKPGEVGTSTGNEESMGSLNPKKSTSNEV